MALARALAVLLCLWAVPSVRAQNSKPIEKEELAKWLNKYNECPDDRAPYFWKLDYYDFKGDGTKQAIVVVSTCMTGTGGPDIHMVVSRDSDGELEEMKVPEVEAKTYDNLFGNRNYTLDVENGLLVANVEDDPSRTAIPLIIRYKWNGKEFAVDSIHKTGVFPTSYDCTKNLTEVENAICHVQELAELDRQLGDAYKTLLAKVPAAERDALKVEQREWLTQRDKQCSIYKGWISCLSDYYQKRIDQLSQRHLRSRA